MYNHIPGMDDIMSDKLTKLTMYIICYNMLQYAQYAQYAIIK